MDTVLRFALLPQTTQHIARCLARAPLLRRRKASHTQSQVQATDGDPHSDASEQRAVQPSVTRERTTWLVHVQSSRVAIALDVGVLELHGVQVPICELTLELRTGDAEAVFTVARQVSQTLSMLPVHDQRTQSLPPVALRGVSAKLTPHMSMAQVAAATLHEMFVQFTANLCYLRESDEPELLHQARIGWRRFKSALQLFKKYPGMPTPPSRKPLQALWSAMTVLRDLDVALAHTLPMFANAYTGGDALRRQQWQAMEQSLSNAVAKQRALMMMALESPAVGASLIEWMQWLASLAAHETFGADKHSPPVGAWLRARMLRLHKQLEQEPVNANDPSTQHRIRILSKRLRYCVEALRPLLPKGRSKRWLQLATSLQENIGAVRDLGCAVEIVGDLGVDVGIVQFLRGVAVGQRMHTR